MSAHVPLHLVAPVATAAFAAAVAVIAVGIGRAAADPRGAGAEFAAALGLGLDLLLAAGLLRLAAGPEVRTLGLVAIVIAVRQISSAGVKTASRALTGMVGGRLRA